MAKISYKLEIGYAGCQEEGELYIDDNMTDEEIDNMINEMAHEHAASWEGDTRLGWHDDMTDEEYDEANESFYENVEGSWEFVEDEAA